jgi:hypothetical protein
MDAEKLDVEQNLNESTEAAATPAPEDLEDAQEMAASDEDIKEVSDKMAEEWEKSLTMEQKQELMKAFMDMAMLQRRRRSQATKKKITNKKRKTKRKAQRAARKKNRSR